MPAPGSISVVGQLLAAGRADEVPPVHAHGLLRASTGAFHQRVPDAGQG